jgi:hypothetical protein
MTTRDRKSRLVQVVHCPVGLPAVVTETEDDLASLQGLVGGGLVQQAPFEDDVDLWCNDEGVLRGMARNRILPRFGVVCGPFFFAGMTRAGNLASVPPRVAADLIKRCNEWLIP